VRRRVELSILPDNSIRNTWLSRECESYLAVCEEETDALHANLQKPTLARSHILHRKLAAELMTHVRASPASCCLLHGVLNAVVHVLTLQETIVDIYSMLKVLCLINLEYTFSSNRKDYKLKSETLRDYTLKTFILSLVNSCNRYVNEMKRFLLV